MWVGSYVQGGTTDRSLAGLETAPAVGGYSSKVVRVVPGLLQIPGPLKPRVDEDSRRSEEKSEEAWRQPSTKVARRPHPPLPPIPIQQWSRRTRQAMNVRSSLGSHGSCKYPPCSTGLPPCHMQQVVSPVETTPRHDNPCVIPRNH